MTKVYRQEAIDEVEGLIETILEVTDGTVDRLSVLRSYCKGRKAERLHYYDDHAYLYAVSMLPEDEREEHLQVIEPKYDAPKFAEKKRIPNKDGFTVCKCCKCGGTGVYAMWVENGRPASTTGTTCYPCNGTGWKYRKAKKNNQHNVTHAAKFLKA